MAIVAFIPIRGGSKSIPFKNIKIFCGYPLVYWLLLAFEGVPAVDKIIVATDNNKIEKVVNSFGFSKVKIYHRLDKNASDTASTESVMLEYLEKDGKKLKDSDTFILTQATSPLIQAANLIDALNEYISSSYDSMLSCVRVKRFYWRSSGTPINYDYRTRPRRQDFEGILMENGAFYLNKIGNIKRDKNRLSGSIGIYEMPEFTSVELDNFDDWILAENLMKKYIIPQVNRKFKNIKLFISDVDGVLTDGSMYYSESGEEMKRFHTYDGMAFSMLRDAGIKTAILTSENSCIVQNRAKKLKINYLFQGVKEAAKLDAAIKICQEFNISITEVAYVGDDINCYDLLCAAGVAACPINALSKIKQIEGIIVLNKKGGSGAVREFVEMIL